MAMAVHYAHHILRVAVAQICQQLSWDAVNSTSLELITCILERYVYDLGQQSRRYAELFGRTQVNLDDLGLAFYEQHINLNELQDYVKHVDLVPFALGILRFPEPKASDMGSSIQDFKTESKNDDDLVSSIDVEDTYASPRVNQDCLPIDKSPPAAGTLTLEKRLMAFSSPVDCLPASKKLRMLPDEAAHCQYEMKSFIRSDSGVLYPKGQGKLADSHSMHIDFIPAESLPIVPEYRVNRDMTSKPLMSKIGRDKVRLRTGTMKGHLSDHASAALSQSCSPRSMHSSVKRSLHATEDLSTYNTGDVGEELVEPSEETVNDIDMKARETRLTAYEDAIDSVIRKVQSDQKGEVDDVCAEEHVEYRLGELTDDVPQLPDVMKVEREARISDIIDAVIAQAKCHSPVGLQGSRPSSSENEESIVVGAADPHVTESCSAVLPLQNANISIANPDRPLSAKRIVLSDELTSIPVGENSVGRGGKARKEKRKNNRQTVNVIDNTAVNPHGNSTPCIEKLSDDARHDSADNPQFFFSDGAKEDVHTRVDRWTDDDSRVPMAAAESLMKLAGVVPPQKRLRISFGPRNEQTVKSPAVFDDHHGAEKLSNNVRDMLTCRPPGIGETTVESKHMLSDKQTEGLQLESSWNEGFACQSTDVEEGQLQQPKGLKSNDRKYRKQAKRIKEKLKIKKNSGKQEKVLSIPKMTIKFGGGASGGTQNSLSVGVGESTNASTQAPLKLVIRPFATDSPTTIAKHSPQHPIKLTRNEPPVNLQSTKHCHMLCLPKNPENKTCISPARFTSSSSSSGSESPYRSMSMDMPRTPTPPALSSPTPLLSSRSPSVSCSPQQSNATESRSPSPPTLYRSPEINEQSKPFSNVTCQSSKSAVCVITSQRNVLCSSIPVLPAKVVLSNVSSVPAIPPPPSKALSSSKSAKAKQLVITETVGKIVDEAGEIQWICPACKMPDDGSPMIGCDICDDWYHWPCVGIQEEPPDEEQWFCKRCADANVLSHVGKRGKNAKKKNGSGRTKLRSKKPSKKK